MRCGQEWACPPVVGGEGWACPIGREPGGQGLNDVRPPVRRPLVREAGTAAAVVPVLLGVVVRLKDLDEAVQGGVGAVALGTQHHNFAV